MCYYVFFGAIGAAMTGVLTWLFYANTLWHPYVAWLAAVNVTALVLYALDKILSKMGDTRTPEVILLALPLLGGVAGTFIGIFVVRHKTAPEHAYFRIVLLISVVLHLVIAYLLLGPVWLQ